MDVSISQNTDNGLAQARISTDNNARMFAANRQSTGHKGDVGKLVSDDR